MNLENITAQDLLSTELARHLPQPKSVAQRTLIESYAIALVTILNHTETYRVQRQGGLSDAAAEAAVVMVKLHRDDPVWLREQAGWMSGITWLGRVYVAGGFHLMNVVTYLHDLGVPLLQDRYFAAGIGGLLPTGDAAIDHTVTALADEYRGTLGELIATATALNA